MLTRTGPAGFAILGALAGCYLSHELPVDASLPADAPVDVAVEDAPPDARDGGRRCEPDDIIVESRPIYAWGDSPTFGGFATSIVSRGGDGFESRVSWTREGSPVFLEDCLPRSFAPYLVAFSATRQHGGGWTILGVTDRFAATPIFPIDSGIPRTSSPIRTFELRPQAPDSTFWVQPGIYDPFPVTRSYRGYCERRSGACPFRFVEVSSDGRLLGGGTLRTRENELTASEREVRVVSFEVRFEPGGAAPAFETVTVEALDCRGVPNVVVPGDVDRWRCGLASAPREVALTWSHAGGAAAGELEVLAGETLHADTLVARAHEGEWVALALAPLEEEVTRLELPPVEAIEGGGAIREAVFGRTVAPAFDHGFLTGSSARVGQVPLLFARNYAWQRGAPFELVPFTDRGEGGSENAGLPTLELSVGVVSTRDGAPWEPHLPRAAVRRDIFRDPRGLPSPRVEDLEP
ncbi:MAG: hypothetical protein KF901_25965 [Myxococcales bacterium]|nr:hypothetical protein [Myxococcales bacterium]